MQGGIIFRQSIPIQKPLKDKPWTSLKWLKYCLSGSKCPTHYQKDLSKLQNAYNGRSIPNMSHLMTKPTKWHVHPTKTQISLPSAQSDQSLCCTHKESLGPELPNECTAKTDQTGWMPRLIWVFAGRICHFVGFVMRQLIWKLDIMKG